MSARASILALALALAVASTACVAAATFQPREGRTAEPQIAGEALRVDEADVPTLEKVGGTVLGTITARGNAYASDQALGEKAARLAATSGGTHVVGVKARTPTGADVDADTRAAEFLVLRVPAERWQDLPPSLRPHGANVATKPTEHAPCAGRRGKYVIQYDERVGTCGAISARADEIASQPTAIAPPCSGTIAYSEDNCTVTVQKTCPDPDTGAQVETHAEMVWSDDGTRAKGSLSRREIADGDVRCESVYEVRESRP